MVNRESQWRVGFAADLRKGFFEGSLGQQKIGLIPDEQRFGMEHYSLTMADIKRTNTDRSFFSQGA